MSALTYRASSGPVKVRIDIKDWDHRDYWGNYDTFAIKPKNRGYQMLAKGYSGVGSYSIGDAFDGVAFDGQQAQQAYTRSSGMRFSTKDQDNDMFCKVRGTYTNDFGQELPRYNNDDKAAQCDKAANAVCQTWQTDETLAKWGSCAGQDGSGFWYNRCSAGNINGRIYKDGYYALKSLEIENSFSNQVIMRDHDDGLIWGTLGKGRDYSFMLAEMRVRPRNFQTRHQMLTTRRGGAAPEDERMHERGDN
jgi:integrin beta 3